MIPIVLHRGRKAKDDVYNYIHDLLCTRRGREGKKEGEERDGRREGRKKREEEEGKELGKGEGES